MPSTGRFKAVLFDLGGTLIKTLEPPVVFKRILREHGIDVSLDEIAHAHEANGQEFDAEEMAKCEPNFWVRANSRLLERLGIQGDRELLVKKIDELWWKYDELKAYPDAKNTLIQLRSKGLKLGVVTNAFRKEFEEHLDKLGLAKLFDIIVGVDDCRKAKPSREIFLHAVDQLGVRPEETLFVGDSIKHDFEGAESAGLKPLLIVRNKKGPMSVKTIRSLAEVLRYV